MANFMGTKMTHPAVQASGFTAEQQRQQSVAERSKHFIGLGLDPLTAETDARQLPFGPQGTLQSSPQGSTAGANALSGTGGLADPAGAGFGGEFGSGGVGQEDLQRAREGTDLLKERFIDTDPFAQAFERQSEGIQATLGRQASLDQRKLRAGLQSMGAGANALRRQMASVQQSTQIAGRFLEASQTLGNLQMVASQRAQQAVNDYVTNYIRIAEAQKSQFATYWGVYNQLQATQARDRSFSGGGMRLGGGNGRKSRVDPTTTTAFRTRMPSRSTGQLSTQRGGTKAPSEAFNFAGELGASMADIGLFGGFQGDVNVNPNVPNMV